MRVLLDRASVEIFAADGEVTHSGIFYPDPADRGISSRSRAVRRNCNAPRCAS
jgi:sucrose-6-phosphate hydrolase SacC (GH32 family)